MKHSKLTYIFHILINNENYQIEINDRIVIRKSDSTNEPLLLFNINLIDKNRISEENYIKNKIEKILSLL
jgi:hypothetical protein